MLKKISYYIITLFHTLAVFFVLLAPFSNYSGILTLNVVYTLSLMLHWYLNNDICCLTVLESFLSGNPTNETFMHKLVNPIYSNFNGVEILGGINENILSKISWAITIISFVVSITRIILSKPKSLKDLMHNKI